MLSEIDNIKILNKKLNTTKLLLFYIYDNNINTKKIELLFERDNYNQNINLYKINSKNTELLSLLNITTFPIIKIFKNFESTEILLSNKNLKNIIDDIYNY